VLKVVQLGCLTSSIFALLANTYMPMKIPMKKLLLVSTVALFFIAGTVSANHSWGKYHWDLSTVQTTANPLDLRNNLTNNWPMNLVTASTDWNASVLKNEVVIGNSNANCDPTAGSVEVCNGQYGNNGWLGIASIWVTRGKDNHIIQGVVKLNDTYFNTQPYNTSAWKNMVMCQEVGHTFGLGHQDENFSNTNLGTCMDYTNDPTGTLGTNGTLNNEKPNLHDYDMMTEIYAHLNSTSGGGAPGSGKGKKNKPVNVGASIDLNNPSSWGKAIKQDARGNNSLFERDLGNGQVLITHVIWIK